MAEDSAKGLHFVLEFSGLVLLYHVAYDEHDEGVQYNAYDDPGEDTSLTVLLDRPRVCGL